MIFFELIYKLHSSDIIDRIEVLRAARHVENSKMVIATGYSFSIHTGSKIQLLYDLENAIVIYQPVVNWQPFPLFPLGSHLMMEGGYYQLLADLSEGLIKCYHDNHFNKEDVRSFNELSNNNLATTIFSFFDDGGVFLKDFPVFLEERFAIFWSSERHRRDIDKYYLSEDYYQRQDDDFDDDELDQYRYEFKANTLTSFSTEMRSCDVCGGDEETGCLMSDPQNCQRGFC